MSFSPFSMPLDDIRQPLDQDSRDDHRGYHHSSWATSSMSTNYASLPQENYSFRSGFDNVGADYYPNYYRAAPVPDSTGAYYPNYTPTRNLYAGSAYGQLPVPTSSSLPLQPAPSTVLNGLEPTTPTPLAGAVSDSRTTGKRKAPGTQAGSNRNKRSKTTASAATAASVNAEPSPICGVGPSYPPDSGVPGNDTTPSQRLDAPASTANSSKSSSQRPDASSRATDIWYFVRPLATNVAPDVIPASHTETRLVANPKCQWLGCKECGDAGIWKVWKNSSGGGITGTVREHMLQKHHDKYSAIVKTEGLKNSKKTADPAGKEGKEAYTKDKFLSLLMRWIVADDQSVNVIETPEFRELMLYLGNGKLGDADLPHRTKLTRMILDEYKRNYELTKVDLNNAAGRISFTTDLWSDRNLDSFMAITAHYMVRGPGRSLIFRTGLIAFKRVLDRHSGVNLAKHFYQVLVDYDITHKIGVITMDNASNNNKMMEELEKIFEEAHIPFEKDGNRIRCFPHVVNLACQAIITEFSKSEAAIGLNFNAPPAATLSEGWNQYEDCLGVDLVGRCRSLVAACRASGHRRRALKNIIAEGNEKGWWRGKLADDQDKLPLLELLRDCVTRWSATFNMIDRIIFLYPAIRCFLLDTENELDDHIFSSQEIAVLTDLHQILEIAHHAQELLSGEKTPTLSMAIPVYEKLIKDWKTLRTTIPELQHFIDVGIKKLEDYLAETRKTRIYAHAMAVNPTMKFDWFEKNRSEYECQEVMGWIKESMLNYQRKRRQEAKVSSKSSPSNPPLSRSSSATSIASARLGAGFDRVQRSNPTVRRSAPKPSPTRSVPTTPSPASSIPSIPASPAETTQEQRDREEREDVHIVDQELQRYIRAGLLPEEASRMCNLISFWQTYEYEYPLLFSVAMDVLPAQASAVPCERVFSSSKETNTVRRSRMDAPLFEALQVLKFSFRYDRLNFVDDLLAKHEDYTISGPLTQAAIDELIASGDVQVLEELRINAATCDS